MEEHRIGLITQQVTLRLTLTVEYAVHAPATVAHAVQDVRDAVYLLVQLAARQYVASVTLDELLEGRDAMTRYLEEQTMAKAAKIGVRIERLGVKDVVLPGEMKRCSTVRSRPRSKRSRTSSSAARRPPRSARWPTTRASWRTTRS